MGLFGEPGSPRHDTRNGCYRSRPAPTSEATGYRSPYTANRDTAAQINTHSPSENSSTKVNASPGLNLRPGSRPE
jgi:hypothetical protein